MPSRRSISRRSISRRRRCISRNKNTIRTRSEDVKRKKIGGTIEGEQKRKERERMIETYLNRLYDDIAHHSEHPIRYHSYDTDLLQTSNQPPWFQYMINNAKTESIPLGGVYQCAYTTEWISHKAREEIGLSSWQLKLDIDSTVTDKLAIDCGEWVVLGSPHTMLLVIDSDETPTFADKKQVSETPTLDKIQSVQGWLVDFSYKKYLCRVGISEDSSLQNVLCKKYKYTKQLSSDIVMRVDGVLTTSIFIPLYE